MVLRSKSSGVKTKPVYKIFFIAIGIAGTILLLTALYLDSRKRILSFSEYTPQLSDQKTVTFPLPTNIDIPKVQIKLPIVESHIKDGVWEISNNSASFLNTSARPGQGGNIVIYGHNKLSIFGKLIGRVKKDDLVEITTENGNLFTYKIIETKTVNPDDINEVLPTNYEVLTIFTCTGLIDSKRFVIKALPV